MIKAKNEIIVYNDHAEIILCHRSGQEKSRALVDLDDIDKIKIYRWRQNDRYVMSSFKEGKGYKCVQLHRFIMDCEEQEILCDHINRNKLDCRKENLRLVGTKENTQNKSIMKNNSSGFIGVSFQKKYKRWETYICVDRKRIHLGFYIELKDAARARIQGELTYFGKHGREVNITKFKYLFGEEV